MPNQVEPQSKTVSISWVEESHHRAVVRVPLDFDASERDIANGLAELRDDGFQFVERTVGDVLTVDDDPAAEFFDPLRYDSDGRSA